LDQARDETLGARLHPVAGEMARNEEDQCGAERGPDRVVRGAPERAEQGAARQGERRTGQEQDRGQRIEPDEDQRCRGSTAAETSLKQ
jgi:hypothetical protein